METLQEPVLKFRYAIETQDHSLKANEELVASRDVLKRLEIPPPEEKFIDLSADMLKNFVFVTAASSNHFDESLDLIGSIQEFMPERVIYYYDIGLKTGQVEILKKLCGVKYRLLNFDVYPEHVATLSTYAFKAISIKEVMGEHSGVFWVDTSIRLKGNNTETFWNILQVGNGMVFFVSAFAHSNFATTRAEMYDFLPTDQEKMKDLGSIGAGAMLLHNTNFVYEHYIKWWVLCALNRYCIAPDGSRKFCDHYYTYEERYHIYRNCHRFEQAALNILVCNAFNHDKSTIYTLRARYWLSIKRYKTVMFKLHRCESKIT
ncbi:unnamed protein product [Owenia fusiformis]|uniref:Uncharacterized protein n=1 Tax=Owenia fusiformis TaxID=6347 RepID=A0A8J1UEN1_OWEFU|nr:unnamed protein product [Owenia fusiformis]